MVPACAFARRRARGLPVFPASPSLAGLSSQYLAVSEPVVAGEPSWSTPSPPTTLLPLALFALSFSSSRRRRAHASHPPATLRSLHLCSSRYRWYFLGYSRMTRQAEGQRERGGEGQREIGSFVGRSLFFAETANAPHHSFILAPRSLA